MKVFDIINPQTNEHHIYTPIYLASDFIDFFQNLYVNEHAQQLVSEINVTAKYEDVDQFFCGRPPGIYRIYWFGNGKYHKFAFKVANEWSWNGQKIEEFNFDFIKGWITNLYVRSFGFEHAEGRTYDALYAHDSQITMDHFMNSVDLMMRMDYVLPFEDRLNHSVWQYLFDEIKDGHVTNASVQYWSHQNKGSHYNRAHEAKQNEEWINSKNIEMMLSDETKRLLQRKNMFDLWLYELATKIADADEAFHQLNY